MYFCEKDNCTQFRSDPQKSISAKRVLTKNGEFDFPSFILHYKRELHFTAGEK